MTQIASTTFNQTTVTDIRSDNNPHEPYGQRWSSSGMHFPGINTDTENGPLPLWQAIITQKQSQRWNEILADDTSAAQAYYGFPTADDDPDLASANIRFQGIMANGQRLTRKYVVRTINSYITTVPLREQTTDEEGNSIASPWMPNLLPPSNIENPVSDNPDPHVPISALPPAP